MRSSRVRIAVPVAAVAAFGLAAVIPGMPAQAAPSTTLVVTEAYGGGGNTGAPLTNDFVELQNVAGAAQSLTGYSVQYISATPGATTTWPVTPLSGSVPGERALPGPGGRRRDPVGAANCRRRTPPARSTWAARRAPSRWSTRRRALTCKTAADCAADPSIVDLVGWGGAVVHEGAADAPATDQHHLDAARGQRHRHRQQRGRLHHGRADTDHPRAPAVAAASGEPGPLRIHDIQGDSWISPQVGNTVTNVPGIVTAHAHRLEQGLLDPGPEPRQRPGHQRGRLRLHQLDPDGRRRRLGAGLGHGQRLLRALQRRDHEHARRTCRSPRSAHRR